MRVYFLFSKLTTLFRALAAISLLLTVSCTASGTVPGASDPGAQTTPSQGEESLAQLPAPSALRTTSAANTRYLKQDAVILEGGNITENGTVTNFGDTELSYQIFSLGPFTEDAPPKVAVISPEHAPSLYFYGSPDVYIGVADYTKDTWQWHAVEAFYVDCIYYAANLKPGDYINPDTGQALLAVAWYGYGSVDLNHTEGALVGSSGSVHKGDIRLKTNEDAALLDGVGVLFGDLHCDAEFNDYASLDGLEAVVGNLYIDLPNLSILELPSSLKYIGGILYFESSDTLYTIKANSIEYAYGLSVYQATALHELQLQGLRELGGGYHGIGWSFVLHDTPQLANIMVPGLERVGSQLSISQSGGFDAPSVTGELDLSSLQECKSIVLWGTNSLDSIKMPNVTELQDCVINSQALESVDFSALETVTTLQIENFQDSLLPQFPQLTSFADNGNLYIRDCPNLTSLNRLAGLAYDGHFGELTIEGCPMLTSLDGLEWLSGYLQRLTLKNNQQLSDLSALSAVEAIGVEPTASASKRASQGAPDPNYSLIISGLPALTSLSDLSLSSVSDNITIAFNDNLANLSGFFSGTEVNGLDIRDNPQLLSCAGLETLESIGSLGIQGNSKIGSLAGLDNVTACTEISIDNNALLINLDNLTSITHAAGTAAQLKHISITGNGLLSISGLSNLEVGTYGYVVGDYVKVENNTSLIGGDQAAWDLIDAWGGESVVGGEISISGNETS